MQCDGEKPDKITRGACACNDDKVIFENPLNWTTRSFIFAKQREYENAKRRSFMPRTQATGKANLSRGITSGLPVTCSAWEIRRNILTQASALARSTHN